MKNKKTLVCTATLFFSMVLNAVAFAGDLQQSAEMQKSEPFRIVVKAPKITQEYVEDLAYESAEKEENAEVEKNMETDMEKAEKNIETDMEEAEKNTEADAETKEELAVEYLNISVDIGNSTETDYKKVYFELTLNDEAEPFIASHILKYKSDKIDITTKEKAEADTTTADKKEDLSVWGFKHEWCMTLTGEDELKEYYNGLKPEDLKENLKSITVTVYWDGGNQSETFPLSLSIFP